MPLSVKAETSQAEREELQVQQESCGQLNNVTAADVTGGLDLPLFSRHGDFKPTEGGIQIAAISQGFLSSLYSTQ